MKPAKIIGWIAVTAAAAIIGYYVQRALERKDVPAAPAPIVPAKAPEMPQDQRAPTARPQEPVNEWAALAAQHRAAIRQYEALPGGRNEYDDQIEDLDRAARSAELLAEWSKTDPDFGQSTNHRTHMLRAQNPGIKRSEIEKRL